MAHSIYSASGFEAARLCPGKPVMEAGKPDQSSHYAREGTAAHMLLEACIERSVRADEYQGHTFEVEGHSISVDDEMVEHIDWCLDQIADYRGDGFVVSETRVNYADDLGVPRDEAWGTSDVIIVRDDEVIAIDLKYGRGVEVDPDCDQTRLYLLGTVRQIDDLICAVKSCRAVILQPRVKRSPIEWDCSVDDLRTWAEQVARPSVLARQAAQQADDISQFLVPGEKQCKFCKSKATCPALRDSVAETVSGTSPASPDEFSDMTCRPGGAGDYVPEFLAAALGKVDMIEDWCKSVRAEAERRLFAGTPVPGWKLVQGKRGARQWSDIEQAEKLLKSFRLRTADMYDMKLVSPASAEKLVKAERIGPRQWAALLDVVTQSAGKPHVAPLTDPRPPIEIAPVIDDFDTLA